MVQHASDEAFLESAASAALGGGEVLAAGIFSWDGLMVAQAVGTVAGGIGGDLVGGGAGSVVGGVAGGRAAVEATAAAKGMTVALLVAVTGDLIAVFNWSGAAAGDEVRRFDRAATDVHVSKMGLSRIVTLRDTTSGEAIELHGSVSPISAQSKPDKVVLHLLSS
jgi:hypothetical protein